MQLIRSDKKWARNAEWEFSRQYCDTVLITGRFLCVQEHIDSFPLDLWMVDGLPLQGTTCLLQYETFQEGRREVRECERSCGKEFLSQMFRTPFTLTPGDVSAWWELPVAGQCGRKKGASTYRKTSVADGTQQPRFLLEKLKILRVCQCDLWGKKTHCVSSPGSLVLTGTRFGVANLLIAR